MATEARPLFDFYFRYQWNEVDFADWQDTMIGTLRDTFGSIFGPALIAGGSVAPSGSTRAVTVAAYETVNEDGYLCVRNSTVLASVSANSSGNPRKDLIVSRPLLTNQSTITRPTSPFDPVPFRVGQDTEIVVIPGTPAGSPVYPSKADGDVIIAGLAVANGASSFSSGDVDTTVTELISGNTNFNRWVVGKDVNGTGKITIGAGTHNGLEVTGGTTGSGGGTSIGVLGKGNGVGVQGEAQAAGGYGVFGQGNTTGPGVSGTGGATDGSIGVDGVSAATNGTGVRGTGSGTGSGVRGDSVGAGPGVKGTGTGAGAAVDGRGTGAGGGVYAEASASGAIGCFAVSSHVAGQAANAFNSAGGIGLAVSNNGGTPTQAALRITPSAQPTGLSAVGDMYMTTAGVLKVCTAAGTPGTWVSVGSQT